MAYVRWSCRDKLGNESCLRLSKALESGLSVLKVEILSVPQLPVPIEDSEIRDHLLYSMLPS